MFREAGIPASFLTHALWNTHIALAQIDLPLHWVVQSNRLSSCSLPIPNCEEYPYVLDALV